MNLDDHTNRDQVEILCRKSVVGVLTFDTESDKTYGNRLTAMILTLRDFELKAS